MGAPGPLPHHRRVATAMLDMAGKPGGGGVFTCGNGDLVLLADPPTGVSLVPTLSRLFRAEAPGSENLIDMWRLPDDEAVIRAAITAASGHQALAQSAAAPLGALALAEAVLRSADLSMLCRRQTGVRITGRTVRPCFQEISLDHAGLERLAGRPVPEAVDPSLCRYLAALLETRLLDEPLSNSTAVPIHLTLSVAGVLSTRFSQARLPPATAIELPFIDAVADMQRFADACRAIRAARCTLLVTGLDYPALMLMRPGALSPDLLKLDWSQRLEALSSRDQQRLLAVLAEIGPSKIVLNRADTEAALAWGLRQGITQFQGRHVDAMLAAERITACRHAAACTLRQCLDRAAATSLAGRAGCRDLALLDGVPSRQALTPPM